MTYNTTSNVTTPGGETATQTFEVSHTKEILDVPFALQKSTAVLLLETVVDSRSFTVQPGHSIIVGDDIEMDDITVNTFVHSKVVGVVGDVITVNAPLPYTFPVGDTVYVRTTDLIVDGSVTPKIFTIKPNPGQQGDILRIVIGIEAVGDMDFSKFGPLTELALGCTLRIKHSDGFYTNLFTWRTNGEFVRRDLDHYFEDKSGGGLHGFVARSRFGGDDNRGVVVRLRGDLSEELQIVVQDDLSTGILHFSAVAQGHEI